MSWLPQEGGPPALALPFTEIAMHAVVSGTGDQAACLYLQLAGGDSDYEDEAEEEGEGASEVWLIPSDPALVEPLFAALSEGAERNPDDGEEGEDEEGGIFFDEEEVLAGTDAALHRLEIEEVSDAGSACLGFGRWPGAATSLPPSVPVEALCPAKSSSFGICRLWEETQTGSAMPMRMRRGCELRHDTYKDSDPT